jgi:threonylcarbamoyladenosine tRNA methylthiotransferase MtaB
MREAEEEGPGISSIAKVGIQTIGCKLNQAESESLARRFLEAGYQIVSPEVNPDLYLLNTCTVTHVADRKCRHLLRLTHRQNPKALIVVTGCYAQRAGQELSQIEGVTLIVGNEDKEQLLDIIGARIVGLSPSSEPSPWPQFRTRALVKIQDGCSKPCSYCIVPRVRGRERDVPQQQILAEVEARVAEGYKEVILTGTTIGGYKGDGGLGGLVSRVLSQTGVQRLRLSSLQPQDLSPSFIQLWNESRLCRHLHLPLQSGCDTVLQRMRRSYSTADYERAVTMARELIPELAVTTDIMVGFPAESDEEFETSYRFCERIGFAGLHIFPYSARPGTVAARMAHKVQPETKKKRSQRMLHLAQKSAQSFRRSFLGRSLTVLWEEEKGDGIWSGLSDNYIRVFSKSEEQLRNRLLSVRLTQEHGSGLWGSVEDDGSH